MNLKPVLGKVIIQVDKQDEKIGNTNLFVPEVTREKELGLGLCLTGKYKGKKVCYKKYAGDEMEVDSKSLFVVDEEDILAVVKEV